MVRKNDLIYTFDEYQTKAQRTANTQNVSDKIENGILGLCGEVGEIADIWKKAVYQGHEFDREHMIKELSDVMWYCAELATGLRISLTEVATMNIDKLMKRYPNGFVAERSIHRDPDDI